ncbi:hypothetical protein COI88_13390 [Bacillus cereus]|nr:hypothetical protein CN296_23950 [Bacillus cereus]PFJ04931.1 hypothetical protein COI88_13390 [Bacillus cereus]PGU34341.1 hypothetical protein COD66_13885 [Bacillus cereus]
MFLKFTKPFSSPKCYAIKKYLEFEINYLLFNHLSCKVIVTKAIESYEKHTLTCFRLKSKVTYSVKTKMNLQKYNENKLKS